MYSDVLAELSGSQIRLDSERTLQRRRRRSLLRRALFWWAEYESEAGDRLVAKRHVAAAVPFGLAGLILILLGVSSMVGHRAATVSFRPPARQVTSVVGGGTGSAATRVPASRPSRRMPAPSIADLLIPDPGLPSGPVPMLPPIQPSLPRPSVTVGSEAPVGPVVFSRASAAMSSAGFPGIQAESASPPSPVVYDRTEPATVHGDSDALAASHAAGPSVRPTLSGSVSAPGSGAATAAPSSPPQWTIGQRVQAHFATGLVVVQGGPSVPVIAESADPKGTWLGHASLGPEGLVQVGFTLAVPGVSSAVRGAALDPGRLVPGLLGRTALRHPQAAGVVAAAALQATADYVQALVRQGQVTLMDGWAQLASGPPAPPWAYVAARLASGFEPRGVADGPVATTEIDAGASLVILLTEVP